MKDNKDFEFLLFDRKNMIKDTIKKYGEENFYMSFSGGKDSTVLSWLIDRALPDNKIPRVFINTGIEFNETVRFVEREREYDKRIVIVKPQVNVKQSLENDGYPFKSKEHSNNLDIYQRHGINMHTVQRYINSDDPDRYRFQCPKCLRYQFTPQFTIRVTDHCCENMKEKPLMKWQKDNHRPISITGIMASEGGRRAKGKQCAVFVKGKLKSFNPLKPVTDDFVQYLIDTYHIEISKLYSAPYNFTRTGCKGCPFNIHLQKELDVMEQYMPAERKQCEIIWKPVYDEYRRIGYRLRPYTQLKLLEDK